MTSKPKRATRPRTAQTRWLLLVHQLPARPSNVRVRTWRRLQNVGAVAVKNSVYALPNSNEAREDFEWIRQEIQAMKGQASVFAADTVDTMSDDDLVASFRSSAAKEYADVEKEARKLLASVKKTKRPRPARSSVERGVALVRERLAAVARRDFFTVSDGKPVSDVLEDIERRLSGGASEATREAPAARLRRKDFRGRLWVTRPRPGIDRMASAWLIRRFVDPEARFEFVDRPDPSANAVPFDMFGVQFGHHGHNCTMETLVQLFGLQDRMLEEIARTVHEVDLKDDRYSARDAPTLERLVHGLQLVHSEDHELLEEGIQLFEVLFRALENKRHRSKRTRSPARKGGGRTK